MDEVIRLLTQRIQVQRRSLGHTLSPFHLRNRGSGTTPWGVLPHRDHRWGRNDYVYRYKLYELYHLLGYQDRHEHYVCCCLNLDWFQGWLSRLRHVSEILFYIE